MISSVQFFATRGPKVFPIVFLVWYVKKVKVDWYQKGFYFDSTSEKKGPNYYLEHYPPKENMLRIVTWTIFLKRKNLLILGHLYVAL